jgi:hypothetical protein
MIVTSCALLALFDASPELLRLTRLLLTPPLHLELAVALAPCIFNLQARCHGTRILQQCASEPALYCGVELRHAQSHLAAALGRHAEGRGRRERARRLRPRMLRGLK